MCMCDNFYTEESLMKLQTPCYIFDLNKLLEELDKIKKYISKEQITYSMKANPFLVEILSQQIEKIEVCSLGELEICISKNIPAFKIVLAGVNKSEDYLLRGLQYGVREYVIESVFQWEQLKRCCILLDICKVQVSLRINIGNQFGMLFSEAMKLVVANDNVINIVGVHMYMGTQNFDITKIHVYLNSIKKFVYGIYDETKFRFSKIVIGCGVPVKYFYDKKEDDCDILKDIVESVNYEFSEFQIEYELGRRIVASCGKYLTKVVEKRYINGKTYIIVDGGTHQLNYYGQMFGRRMPCIKQYPQRSLMEKYTVCGSLCSASDILIFERELSKIFQNDLLCFENAGAYTITEGMFLFLSHDLPQVYILDLKGSLIKKRDFIKTSKLNGG